MKAKQRTEAQIGADKKKLGAWLRSLLSDDYDKFDLEAEFDSTLTYSENKSQLREKVRYFLKNDLADIKKEEIEQYKAEQEKLQNERNTMIEKEIYKYNNQKITMKKSIDSYYKDINRAVSKVQQKFSHLCFVKGRGGIGKSYNIRKVLVNTKEDFVEVCGDVTEAYLYRLFFENNGKIIWFKDVAKLLKGLASINLLKAATETESVKLLTKSNYSRQQDDLPPRFIWTGRIIFDYNSLEGLSLKQDFEALMTRGDYIEFSLSMEDVEHIMREIAKTKEEKETTEFLISEYIYTGYDLLNLRTQWRAFQTRKWAVANNKNWKTEIRAELKNNQSRIRKMIYSLIGNKAIKSIDLKKLLIRSGVVPSLRTADRRVAEWLVLEEIFVVSEEQRNPYIALNQLPKGGYDYSKK